MKIFNWFVRLLSKTVGSWHLPYINKGFKLEEYFKIEKKIREFSNPFVVGVVKTKGEASNLLIAIAQFFSSENRCYRVTHAIAHIGLYDGYKHRVVESIGVGVIEVPLLQSIGQRDVVILRRPNPQLINDTVCRHAIEYIQAVADRDKTVNIQYDFDHDYSIVNLEEILDYSKNNIKLDCSETVMQALEHGFRMTGQKSLIKMVKRVGKPTWTPSDVFCSELFITFYDSDKGFIDG